MGAQYGTQDGAGKRPTAPEPSRFVGALLGGAMGDAVGFPYEGTVPPYRPIRPLDYPSSGDGLISDDTELTMALTECLLSQGWLDPNDWAARLVRWLPGGTGKGRATIEGVSRLAAHIPWYRAGVRSSGNGAAMRVAPIGLLRWNCPPLRRAEALLSALPTHHDAMAAASAVMMAEAVAYLVVRPVGSVDPELFVETMVRSALGMEQPQAERRNPASRTTLVDRMREVPGRLGDGPTTAVRDYFYSGAYVLESLPTAVWCFLRHPQEPDAALAEALAVSRDADTVAALTGTFAGALNGAAALPQALVPGLKGRQDIENNAIALWRLAVANDLTATGA